MSTLPQIFGPVTHLFFYLALLHSLRLALYVIFGLRMLYICLYPFTGTLLRRMENGLRGLSHIIVDEIHERDLNVSRHPDIIWYLLHDNLILLHAKNENTDQPVFPVLPVPLLTPWMHGWKFSGFTWIQDFEADFPEFRINPEIFLSSMTLPITGWLEC